MKKTLRQGIITVHMNQNTATVGLTENGPYELTLPGNSSFHKVLNLFRLFGEFHIVYQTTGKLIEKKVDFSIVKNIEHS